jgi:putative ABC transport system ATP-binding protein
VSSATLELRNVTRIFETGTSQTVAVDDASLRLDEGEIVIVLGPSGSGKTTLLSLAGCLLKPTSGSISVMGNEVSQLSQSRLQPIRLKHIGFVFQTFNLLEPLSAVENVLIALNLAGGNGATARDRALELLASVGLSDRVAQTAAAELSAGEKQRVAIARALANHPDLVLADEPTANLDSANGRRVMTTLRESVTNHGTRSLIIVTHDERILDFADKVYWMEDGRLTLKGAESLA